MARPPSNTALGRSANGLDLLADSEALQCPHDESAGRKLLFEERMRAHPGLAAEHQAIRVDLIGKALHAIGGKANLQQKLDPAAIRDPVFALCAAVAGRLTAIPGRPPEVSEVFP
jgi:hypothetical protein